jgi:hypothetical protein
MDGYHLTADSGAINRALDMGITVEVDSKV